MYMQAIFSLCICILDVFASSVFPMYLYFQMYLQAPLSLCICICILDVFVSHFLTLYFFVFQDAFGSTLLTMYLYLYFQMYLQAPLSLCICICIFRCICKFPLRPPLPLQLPPHCSCHLGVTTLTEAVTPKYKHQTPDQTQHRVFVFVYI